MYKNATYKEKYADLKDWFPAIIEKIKKDLKSEHLLKDPLFVKKYLSTSNLNKVSGEELTQAYQKAIAQEEQAENIGEFITTRWMLKHTELYDFFDQYLSQKYSDFTVLEEIDSDTSNKLIEAASSQFGMGEIYIFAVLNSVVFPTSVFHALKAKADQAEQQKKKTALEQSEKLSLEKDARRHEEELSRLADKYEKKLAGLQKKYLLDTQNLKKQIAQLQRKLQNQS